MSCMIQYMTKTADDDCDTAFDNKEEAIAYAREHGFKVVVEEFEYSDSYPLEGGDFTGRYTVVLRETTVREKRVRVKASSDAHARAVALAGEGEWCRDWQYVQGPTVDVHRCDNV